jgi:hypothetical protein
MQSSVSRILLAQDWTQCYADVLVEQSQALIMAARDCIRASRARVLRSMRAFRFPPGARRLAPSRRQRRAQRGNVVSGPWPARQHREVHPESALPSPG